MIKLGIVLTLFVILTKLVFEEVYGRVMPYYRLWRRRHRPTHWRPVERVMLTGLVTRLPR